MNNNDFEKEFMGNLNKAVKNKMLDTPITSLPFLNHKTIGLLMANDIMSLRDLISWDKFSNPPIPELKSNNLDEIKKVMDFFKPA